MRYTKIALDIISVIFLTCIIASCKRSNNASVIASPSVSSEVAIESSNASENLVEVVVDDSTGEILGIKANQVGDYYLINPGDEQMISIDGHSIKFVPEDVLNQK